MKALGKRIDLNSIRFIDNQTAYMCIQVDKNSTEKTCKIWTKDEFNPLAINIVSQDEGLQKYFQELVNNLSNTINEKMQDSMNNSTGE